METGQTGSYDDFVESISRSEISLIWVIWFGLLEIDQSVGYTVDLELGNSITPRSRRRKICFWQKFPEDEQFVSLSVMPDHGQITSKQLLWMRIIVCECKMAN